MHGRARSLQVGVMVVVMLVWVGIVGSSGSAAPTGSRPTPAPGAPVTFQDKPLFDLHARVGSFSPHERADAVSRRLVQMAEELRGQHPQLAVIDDEHASDVVMGDRLVVTITDEDARAVGRPRPEVARDYARRTEAALRSHAAAFGFSELAVALVMAAVATAVFIGLLVAAAKLFPRLSALIASLKGTRIRSLRVQRLELLSAERIAAILLGLARAVRAALTLVLLYAYIAIVFSFFPWTRGLAADILRYSLEPARAGLTAFVSYLPDLIVLIIIILVTWYMIKLASVLFAAVARGAIRIEGFYREWAIPTYKIVRFIIIAAAAAVAFPYIPGSHSPAFQGISVFIGVLLSLGSTSAVANVVAGVILTYMRPFQIGDRVKIADTNGSVMEKTLLVTRVRTIRNVDITIPNAMVLGSHIVNFSSSCKSPGIMLHTSVTIGYDTPWRRVHALLTAAALATPHVLKEPAPFVLQTRLNDFHVTYELEAYTDRPEVMEWTYSALHEQIQDQFHGAGIEIMSPHYTQLRDGNRTAIPSEYLEQGYAPGALRVASVQARVDGKDGSGRLGEVGDVKPT